MIIVSKEKDGDFTAIQEAVDHAREGDTIFIREGIYKERVTVKTPGLTIIGSNSCFKETLHKPFSITSFKSTQFQANNYLPSDKTVISLGLFAQMPSEDIGRLGTFRTYTMLIDAPGVTLKNLTIENSSGASKDIGQAIALYAEGEGLKFENIRLLGWQDTLFTGPLPEKEIEKHGFIGPKEFSPRINGRQYYKNSYIEGDIDFIFGSATAYFENCTIFQKDRDKYLFRKHIFHNFNTCQEEMESFLSLKYKEFTETHESMAIKSYATAASTPEGQKYGYIFDSCRFESDCPTGSCYLGRPWRNHAHVLIRNSYLGPQISPHGFHNWNKKDAEATVRFQEYENYGPGAFNPEKQPQHRASFSKELSSSEISAYKKSHVIPFIN